MRETIKLNLHWKNGGVDGINDSALENDLKLMQETFCKTVIERAIPTIEKFAAQEIEGYYEEYDPKYAEREEEGNPPDYYYIRTNQMMDKSFQRFSITEGKTYQGGIEFDPSETKHTGGYRRGAKTPSEPGLTEEQIYTSVWDLGYHGRTSYTYRVHDSVNGDHSIIETHYIGDTPHRFDRVIEKASAQSVIDRLRNAGLSAVQKQNYSMIRFR